MQHLCWWSRGCCLHLLLCQVSKQKDFATLVKQLIDTACENGIAIARCWCAQIKTNSRHTSLPSTSHNPQLRQVIHTTFARSGVHRSPTIAGAAAAIMAQRHGHNVKASLVRENDPTHWSVSLYLEPLSKVNSMRPQMAGLPHLLLQPPDG